MQEIDPSEIDRRLKREGAGSGDIRISLIWHTIDDLDLHCITPGGEEIYYGQKTSSCGGRLDVDMNRDRCTASACPVENIFWHHGQAPTGGFQVFVIFFARHSSSLLVPFQVRVQNRGSSQTINGCMQRCGEKSFVTRFDSQRFVAPVEIHLGKLYKGTFELELTVLDVEHKSSMASFISTVMARLGACHTSSVKPAQMSELDRLSKILDRVDDVRNFAGERENAARLLQSLLAKLEWDECSLRAACGGLRGSDTGRPALAKLQFTKRVTSRREWFEEHAQAIANPMGVAVSLCKATGHFGRIGHNGVVLVGTPAAVALSAAFIARSAEAALHNCSKSDVDAYCGNFCRQVRPDDASNPDARRRQLQTSMTWLQTRFGCNQMSAEYNTPKKFRQDTPTAEAGRLSGQKRKAEWEPEMQMLSKHHMLALTY